MPWFSINLTEQEIAKRKDLCLEHEFNAVLEQLEANRCLAMYRDAQDQSVFYIVCDNACQMLHGLIRFYSGMPCRRPDLNHLLEVTGHFDDHLVEQIS